jgi:hypothetical protein
MKLRSAVRNIGLAIALAGALSATHLSANVTEFFDGGGYGPTADYAVQAAMWDAEASANSWGYYKCQLIDDPTVFSQPTTLNLRRAFRAQVRLFCEP